MNAHCPEVALEKPGVVFMWLVALDKSFAALLGCRNPLNTFANGNLRKLIKNLLLRSN
jgi:hypothetical protein